MLAQLGASSIWKFVRHGYKFASVFHTDSIQSKTFPNQIDSFPDNHFFGMNEGIFFQKHILIKITKNLRERQPGSSYHLLRIKANLFESSVQDMQWGLSCRALQRRAPRKCVMFSESLMPSRDSLREKSLQLGARAAPVASGQLFEGLFGAGKASLPPRCCVEDFTTGAFWEMKHLHTAQSWCRVNTQTKVA